MNLKEKELKLWEDWSKNGDRFARDQLLRSLGPLLNKEVSKYAASPLPRTALETEARILALKAFETYDPTKSQLNTHVTNHLKHLQRYVLTYQNIGKIPEHRGIAIGKYKNTFDNLSEDFNREPTEVELADSLGWSLPEVERMQLELRNDLNIVARDDSSDEQGGFFDYSQDSSNSKLKDALMLVYYDADSEDKKILEYSFGIGGGKQKKISEIAPLIHKSDSYVKRHLKQLARDIQNARL